MTASLAPGRDWLAELRGTDDQEEFTNLVEETAWEAPELRDEVCAIAREKFGLEAEKWAARIFVRRELPGAELELIEDEAEEASFKNLSMQSLAAPKADDAGELNAAIAETKSKAEPVRRRKPESASVVASPKKPNALEKLGLGRLLRKGDGQPKEEDASESQPEPPEEDTKAVAIVPTPLSGFFISPEAAPEPEAEETLILDPATPFDNAQKLVSLRAWHRREGIRTLQYWQHSFWEWTATHWREVEDETVRAAIWHQLNAAEKFGKRGLRARFEPQMQHVNAMIDALRGAVNLRPKENPMPGWFGAGGPVGDLREVIACQNGLLHVPTRSLLPHSPRFWSANVLDFGYDPQARAPRFERFLEEVWRGDSAAQEGLLEMYGYCLTDLTKYQKAFMFVGPPRGGRGTIGRVLRGLIGKENYIGTTLKAFSEQFGMENFIGKKVAVFSDARLDGVPQRNLTTIAERFLQITGEDEMPVNRKNSKYWNGQLTTRIVLFANELLRFQDESGALAGRWLTWQMRESFKGREDHDLTNKLLAERAGILNLALDALDRLRVRGRLLQPDTGAEMSERLGDITSDVKVFIEDCCVVGSEEAETVDKLFTRWQSWCAQRGIRHSWGTPQFSEKLRSVVPTLRSGRPRQEGTKRPTLLTGIGLRKR